MFVGRKGKKRGFKGFTLVELVIVLVILGVLVALAVPRFTTSAEKAKETTFCSNVRTIKSQLELYRMQKGSYPSSDADFKTFLGNTEYFENKPVNPYTNKPFGEADPKDSNEKGYFSYTVTDSNLYTLTTTPSCDIVQ